VTELCLRLSERLLSGTIEGWHPANKKCLESRGISRRQGTLLQKICVADAIAGSELVWTLFQRRLTSIHGADGDASSDSDDDAPADTRITHTQLAASAALHPLKSTISDLAVEAS